MNYKIEVARKLLEIEAVKLQPEDPFTWASGMRSPIYCDNRLSLSFPDVRNLIKLGLADLAGNETYDLIGGVATAGIPHGMLLADALKAPYIYVRSSAKSHGRQNQIEGKMTGGARVLLVEDLISTGGSSLKAVDAIRNEGGIVDTVLAIFTYGFQKARDNAEKHNCTFKTITDYPTLIEVAQDMNYITESGAEILSLWNKDPESWYDNNMLNKS